MVGRPDGHRSPGGSPGATRPPGGRLAVARVASGRLRGSAPPPAGRGRRPGSGAIVAADRPVRGDGGRGARGRRGPSPRRLQPLEYGDRAGAPSPVRVLSAQRVRPRVPPTEPRPQGRVPDPVRTGDARARRVARCADERGACGHPRVRRDASLRGDPERGRASRRGTRTRRRSGEPSPSHRTSSSRCSSAVSTSIAKASTSSSAASQKLQDGTSPSWARGSETSSV